MFGGLKTIGIRLLIINNNNNHGNCVHEHYHLIFGIKTMIMLLIYRFNLLVFGGLVKVGMRLLKIDDNHGNCVFGIKIMIMLSIQLAGLITVGIRLGGAQNHSAAMHLYIDT